MRNDEKITVEIGWGDDCETGVDFAEMNFGSVRYVKIEKMK